MGFSSVFKGLNIDFLRMVCFAYFHFIIKHGVNFWGISNNINHLFTSQNTKIRIISVVGAKISCRNLFKKIDILPVSFQYISIS